MESTPKKANTYRIGIFAFLSLVVLIVIIGKLATGPAKSLTTVSKANNNYDSLMATDTIDVNASKNSYADSFILTQQKIAYGTLKFGMSKSEYYKSKNQYSADIGDYHYNLGPNFNHNGRFYKLYISGNYKDANYLNTDVEKETYNLISAISAKYGNGNKTELNFPSILNFTAGYIQTVQSWTIGTKSIIVGVGEVSDGAEYYACALIEDEDMSTEQDSWELNKTSAKQKKDASNF